MRIGLDIMGGDFAPQAIVEGAILARKDLPQEIQLVLIGNQKTIAELLAAKGVENAGFEIVHSSERIGMGEHPAKAFSSKTNSSIHIGFSLLHQKKIDGFASAGNTGAMLVGSMYTVKSVPGIIRPAIAAAIPRPEGERGLILDVGLNPDCKADVLYQYAILGSVYAQRVYGIKTPRVGLLNIGGEEGKGNLLTKAAYELMKDASEFHFAGNTEGFEIFTAKKADVIVCNGFVGNIVLKQAESFYSLIKKRNIQDDFFEQFNFEQYGGTPILGINAPVVIGHGISGPRAIKNMIIHTKGVIEANLPETFKEIFQ